MEFTFQLRARTRLTNPKKLADLVESKLAEIAGCQFRLAVEVSAAVALPVAASAKLESYAEKLERLNNTLKLIARDFDAPHPYGATISRVKRQKNLTTGDAAQLQVVEQLSARAPLLSRIKRWLVDLPDLPELATLQFKQRLVRENFDLPRLYRDPSGLDTAVLQAFEDYRAEFVRIFSQRLSEREAVITAWQKQLPEIERQIRVIAALDSIRTLGAPQAPALAAELADLSHRHAALGISRSEWERILTTEPSVGGITFFTPLPGPDFASFAERVGAALTAKLKVIGEKSVLTILSASRDPSIKKLTKLLSLTQLSKLTALFTPKTTPKIVHELTKLLDSDQLTSVSFGDFIASVPSITSTAEAQQVSAEFAKFLDRKLTETRGQLLLVK